MALWCRKSCKEHEGVAVELEPESLVVPSEDLQRLHLPAMFLPCPCGCEEVTGGTLAKVLLPC